MYVVCSNADHHLHDTIDAHVRENFEREIALMTLVKKKTFQNVISEINDHILHIEIFFL